VLPGLDVEDVDPGALAGGETAGHGSLPVGVGPLGAGRLGAAEGEETLPGATAAVGLHHLPPGGAPLPQSLLRELDPVAPERDLRRIARRAQDGAGPAELGAERIGDLLRQLRVRGAPAPSPDDEVPAVLRAL